MIRSMLMDGLVLVGIVLSLYALKASEFSADNLFVLGVASFVLGVIGGRHR